MIGTTVGVEPARNSLGLYSQGSTYRIRLPRAIKSQAGSVFEDWNAVDRLFDVQIQGQYEMVDGWVITDEAPHSATAIRIMRDGWAVTNRMLFPPSSDSPGAIAHFSQIDPTLAEASGSVLDLQVQLTHFPGGRLFLALVTLPTHHHARLV